MRYLTEFERLKVGATFSMGGNGWLKRSTRTAEIIRPNDQPYTGKWFYFGMTEKVEIHSLVELVK